jgi:hypothetical protein
MGDNWGQTLISMVNSTPVGLKHYKIQGILSMGQSLQTWISRARLPFVYRQEVKVCWDTKSPLNAIWPLQLQTSVGIFIQGWMQGKRGSYRYWKGTKSTKTPNTTFPDKTVDTMESQLGAQYQGRNYQGVTGSNPWDVINWLWVPVGIQGQETY